MMTKLNVFAVALGILTFVPSDGYAGPAHQPNSPLSWETVERRQPSNRLGGGDILEENRR